MADVAAAVDERSDAALFTADVKLLVDERLLDHLHWSEELQSFADYGLHTDGVVLKRPPPPSHRPHGTPVTNSEKVRGEEGREGRGAEGRRGDSGGGGEE